MGCCGGKSRRQAAGQIGRAYVRHAAALIIKNRPSKEIARRYAICKTCEFRTWLTRRQRAAWVLDNVGQIVVNPHTIPDKTGELPVAKKQSPRTTLFCRACRCKCVVKAQMLDGKCCKGFWPLIIT